MTSDESYPCPPQLREFFEKRVEMHREAMTENGWDEDAESITEMVDDVSEAFRLGQEYGMYKFGDLGTRFIAREFNELRFETEDELEEVLQDHYTTAWSVHEVVEHDDGTATVSLSRSWSDMDDDMTVHVYELDGCVTAKAIPYGAGYAVDFGPRTEMYEEFADARHHADDEDIQELDLYDEE